MKKSNSNVSVPLKLLLFTAVLVFFPVMEWVQFKIVPNVWYFIVGILSCFVVLFYTKRRGGKDG